MPRDEIQYFHLKIQKILPPNIELEQKSLLI